MISFYGCQEDIDLIYDGTSRPVAYCLLNPRDSIHYLRVSRSFIVRGNPASETIPADSLILDSEFYAYLEAESPDGSRDLNYFELADMNQRDSGRFPKEGLVVLKTNCPVEGGKSYGLYIYFPTLSRIVAGSVTVADPIKILDPDPLPGREITILEDQGYMMRWTKSVKFAVYQPVIRFIYLEGDSHFQVRKQLEIPQPLVFGDSENAILTSFLNGAGFIDDLAKNIPPPDSGQRRKIIGFDILLTTGGPELAVFIRSGENAIGSFTGLDEYSNLDGAVGLYSSITYTGVYNNRFSDITVNHLADSDKTRTLGFLRYDEDFQ
ncbi:MAG TPA: hypothetical protein DC042_03405 [Bacteroidales bacterium]|nr:hypothetical protein [Bacteroidales bacterium]